MIIYIALVWWSNDLDNNSFNKSKLCLNNKFSRFSKLNAMWSWSTAEQNGNTTTNSTTDLQIIRITEETLRILTANDQERKPFLTWKTYLPMIIYICCFSLVDKSSGQQQFQQIQWLTCLNVTGVMRTWSTAALEVLLGIYIQNQAILSVLSLSRLKRLAWIH